MAAKDFKSYREQVALLISRGMIVADQEEAQCVLSRIN